MAKLRIGSAEYVCLCIDLKTEFLLGYRKLGRTRSHGGGVKNAGSYLRRSRELLFINDALSMVGELCK